VELLATENQRRVTPDDQLRFRESIKRPCDRFDDIDHEAAGDPIHDHLPQARAKYQVRGVLGILDQLDRNTNRRCNR
jgi:hypothetical protein